METAPFQPPINPAEAAAAHGPAPIDMATAHAVMADPEAAGRGNRLLQIGAKIGEMATDLYQRTVVGVGNVMSGTRPEAAAPTPDAAPEGRSRWETFADRVALGGNVIKWGTLAVGVGAVAVKAMAARHGMEAGGAGGHHFQAVADVMPLADAAKRESEKHAAEALVAGAVVATVGVPFGVAMGRKAMRNARRNRADAVRRTRDQPRILPYGAVADIPQPSADVVIRNRAIAANEAKLRRRATGRTGVPVHLTEGYTNLPGMQVSNFARYNPMERITPAAQVRPGAPTRMWRYFFGRNKHFD